MTTGHVHAPAAGGTVIGPVAGHPHIQYESILYALLAADGRTLTVPATGGGCVTGVHLTKTETAADVQLRLFAHLATAEACPADIVDLQASAVLDQPLGTRRLIDGVSGRAVAYIPGRDLAQPGWLPAGAGKPRDVPQNGWTRIYSFPATQRLGALTITENPHRFANPEQFTDNRSSSRPVRINGTPGQLVVEHFTNGGVDEDFVGWVAGRYSVIVSCIPDTARQGVVPPRSIVRVARSLRIPASAR